jgi:c-di-AMP phosphodiesterase-like protein
VLLEYQPTEQRLSRLESTIMYAGIIVDTRNFTLRTGSRTFDAASYLRAHALEPWAIATPWSWTSTVRINSERLIYVSTSSLRNTIMYAGIIVDTRNFTLRTGSRTFDAASYLRAHGADTILTQQFLKDDVDTYINRSELIRTVVSLQRKKLQCLLNLTIHPQLVQLLQDDRFYH